MFTRAVLATICLLALAPAALAHSFNVTLLVPIDSSDKTGDAVEAFLLASGERDAHAGEESDGHLGGLDVYLEVIAANYLTFPPEIAVMESAPDIIAELANALSGRGFEGMLDGAGPAMVKIPALTPEDERAYLMSGPAPFAVRFEERTGRAPGEIATLAYVAARRIDEAVRALGGVEERAALARLLQR